jgi:hypothetical protein
MPVYADRIHYHIGLFCGHLKSTAFAELLAWQCGVAPDSLCAINFRDKLPGRMAFDYGIRVRGQVDAATTERDARVATLFGADWGLGFFKYQACDFCDDVVCETADVSIGDAWLPEYARDGRGANIIVTRDPRIEELIRTAVRVGRLAFDPSTAETVYQSQAGGFRHRRQGLAYRLYLKDASNEWRPPKRVTPQRLADRRTRKIVELRSLLATESHAAWQDALAVGSYRHFVTAMSPLVRRYRRCYAPIWRRMVNQCRKVASGAIRHAARLSRLFWQGAQ